MYIVLLFSELAAMLRHAVARRFETNPRTSLAVAATGGLLAMVVVWSLLSALLWPPKRHVYASVAGTVTSVTGTPVAHAIVLFIDEAAGVGSSGRTDSGGGYVARGVQPGRYAVAIQPVVASGGGELTKEAVAAARAELERSVPLTFHDTATSGLSVEVKRGRNRYDVNLSGRR